MTAPAPLAFCDTETSDIGHRRLAWELAVIRREPDGTRRELQVFIEIDLTDANPFALTVGRFHDRHPLGKWLASGPSDDICPPAADAFNRDPRVTWGADGGIKSVTDWYVTQAQAAGLWCQWTAGAHIVGAVPNFDTEVMGAAARAAGLLPAHHYHLIDVENLIVGYLRRDARADASLTDAQRAHLADLCTPPWKSDDLFAGAGIVVPDSERHTALGDARACEKAYDHVMGLGA